MTNALLEKPATGLYIQPVNLPADTDAWEAFVAQCPMATLLHTQRFLSYHGNRFTDASLWIIDNDERVGLLPAALSLSDPTLVVSHPGITFGGLLHTGELTGERLVTAMHAMAEYYRGQGLTEWIYKTIPAMFHQQPSEGDRFALFQLGAQLSRCDLSATIDLPNRPPWNKKRIKNMKQVGKQNIEIRSGFEQFAVFWPILERRLAAQYQNKPVHTLAEIQLLAKRFPEQIQCWVGYKNGEPVGGTVLFISPTVVHTQYIAAAPAGLPIAALDAILEATIEYAIDNNIRYFDFGHSNYRCPETNRWLLNESLYKFKTKFGASSTVYETFSIALIN